METQTRKMDQEWRKTSSMPPKDLFNIHVCGLEDRYGLIRIIYSFSFFPLYQPEASFLKFLYPFNYKHLVYGLLLAVRLIIKRIQIGQENSRPLRSSVKSETSPFVPQFSPKISSFHKKWNSDRKNSILLLSLNKTLVHFTIQNREKKKQVLIPGN